MMRSGGETLAGNFLGRFGPRGEGGLNLCNSPNMTFLRNRKAF